MDLKQMHVETVSADILRAESRGLTALLGLNYDRLLYGYRAAAGLPPRAQRYSGAESRIVSGHTLAFALSALARAAQVDCGAAESKGVTDRISFCLDELSVCERDGYLGAFLQEAFDCASTGEGSPWFSVAALLQGLTDLSERCGRQDAGALAEGFAHWIGTYALTADKDTLTRSDYGMSDALYRLYRLTKNERIRVAAEKFTDEAFFLALARGESEEITVSPFSIAKACGGARRFEQSRETMYYEALRAYFGLLTGMEAATDPMLLVRARELCVRMFAVTEDAKTVELFDAFGKRLGEMFADGAAETAFVNFDGNDGARLVAAFGFREMQAVQTSSGVYINEIAPYVARGDGIVVTCAPDELGRMAQLTLETDANTVVRVRKPPPAHSCKVGGREVAASGNGYLAFRVAAGRTRVNVTFARA